MPDIEAGEGAGMLRDALKPSRLICMAHRRDGFIN